MKTRSLFAGILAGAGLAWFLYKRSRAHQVVLEPVQPFDSEKFLGKWYEFARLDNCFERNLNNTTAHYSLNRDGTLRVVNKGYNYVTHEHKQAVGTARFAGPRDVASLEVSFWGPFFSDYTVLALDKHYKYALVAGGDRDYLWILSREINIPDKVLNHFLELAYEIGYDIDKLVRVEHDHVTNENQDSLINKTFQQLFSKNS
jgi:apolipoprotein D and lipocalin family protein